MPEIPIPITYTGDFAELDHEEFDIELVKKAALLSDVKLQPHQQTVLDRFKGSPNGRMLLVHALGSGKSLTGLGVAEQSGKPYTAIVPAALRTNMHKEIEKFTDQKTPSNVVSYTGVSKGMPVNNLGTILLDEAHRLRNPNSKQTMRVKDWANKADRVVMMSGSPIVNNPSDLAPLLSILNKKEITPEEFDNRFLEEKQVNPTFFQRLRGVTPGIQEGLQNKEELEALLKGHVDWYEPKTPTVGTKYTDIPVDMSTQQSQLYQAMYQNLPWLMRWKLKMSFPLNQNELAKLTAFMTGPREVGLSVYPFQRHPDALKAFDQSGKLQAALAHLQKSFVDPRKKALVFSNFVRAGLIPYQAALNRAGISNALFHGGLSDDARKKIVEDYNNNKIRTVLLGPSGSEGLSFRGTNVLQTLDEYWNSVRNRQSAGRGIRYDSHFDLPADLKNVEIQRFIAKLPLNFWQRLVRSVTGKNYENQRRGTDDFLRTMSERKDRTNKQFLNVLQNVGSQHEEKAANIKEIKGNNESTTDSRDAIWTIKDSSADPARKTDRLHVPMRLRNDEVDEAHISDKNSKSSAVLWMSNEREGFNANEETGNALYDGHTRIWDMVGNERSMFKSEKQGLSQLWRTRNSGLSKLAQVRELFQGYGQCPSEVDIGAKERERELLSGELLLGYDKRARKESTKKQKHNVSGQNVMFGGVGRIIGYDTTRAPMAMETKLADRKNNTAAAGTAQKSAEIQGIPDKRDYGDLSKLQIGQLVDFFKQKHLAERAGKHFDLRLGTPETGLYSWAVRKDLPKPGKPHLAVQTQLHDHDYGKFEGEIPSGYGKGSVTSETQGKALITDITPEAIDFSLAHTRYPERFKLIRPKDDSKNWLLINTTPTESLEGAKVKYKTIDPKDVEHVLDTLQPGSSVQAKLDGALTLTKIMHKHVDMFSHRTSKVTDRPIVHTERIMHQRLETDIPKDLRNITLRSELYGVKDNQTIPVQELGGLLNSSIAKSITDQKDRNIQLRSLVFDAYRSGKHPVDLNTPYPERMKLIKDVLSRIPLPGYHAAEEAKTPEEAKALWQQIQANEHPLTNEGIVIHEPTGVPIKAKIRPEFQVHVHDITPGEGKYKGTGAGGFSYSHEAGGKPFGVIGTGLSDELRKDMLSHPNEYKGRIARVLAHGKLPSGALRIGAFKGFHEDYPSKIANAQNRRLIYMSTDAPAIKLASNLVKQEYLRKTSGIKKPDEFGTTVQQLLAAKLESDKRNYAKKVSILNTLMQKNPSHFIIDNIDKNIAGVTHKRTGFRIHIPIKYIPIEVKQPKPLITPINMQEN